MTTGHWQISVSGPGGFFANGENGELDAILPRAGVDAPEVRECFVYFISGDKVRAPHAAMALLRRLGPS